eukprot:9814606-Lingulodinium_polyedra.AAC.1
MKDNDKHSRTHTTRRHQHQTQTAQNHGDKSNEIKLLEGTETTQQANTNRLWGANIVLGGKGSEYG